MHFWRIKGVPFMRCISTHKWIWSRLCGRRVMRRHNALSTVSQFVVKGNERRSWFKCLFQAHFCTNKITISYKMHKTYVQSHFSISYKILYLQCNSILQHIYHILQRKVVILMIYTYFLRQAEGQWCSILAVNC